jgi:diguanylate cyclase
MNTPVDTFSSETSQSTQSVDTDEAAVRNRSAELLRLTLPLLSRHSQSFRPAAYAIWYEYVRAENQGLRMKLDPIVEAGTKLTREQTAEIYVTHIVGRLEESLRKGKAELLEVMESIDGSVETASQSTTRLNSRLGDFAGSLENDPSPDTMRQVVGEVRDDLVGVQESVSGLNEHLDASREEINRLQVELKQARAVANVDSLTNLANRRSFDEAIEQMIQESVRGDGNDGSPLSIIVVDIDHFKLINDNHGHVVGDNVLRSVASIMEQGVMRKDRVARIGGEEFAILLPATDGDGARLVAERIRVAISRFKSKNKKISATLGQVTVSCGVGIYRPDETPEEFVARADAALYQAKGSGRNKVCMEAPSKDQ